MGITYNEELKRFHLQSQETSYIFDIFKGRYLAHVYWGKKIHGMTKKDAFAHINRPGCANPDPDDKSYSLNTIPQEYPEYGHTDFRIPAFQVEFEDGTRVADPHYRTHRIFQGKTPLEGLPASYAGSGASVETLEVELVDPLSQLVIILSYSVFEELDVITRSVKFVNEGSQNITLTRALSMAIDFPDMDYDMLHLSGAWANEANMIRRPLAFGMQSIDSKRGVSSHHHNPFVALLDPSTTEHNGNAYAFAFVYSGNFLAEIEVDTYSTTRVCMGINPFDFAWELAPQQTFQTPEVIMVFADRGLNQMSQRFHRFLRDCVTRGKFQHAERPMLVNNWEGTYFDFDEEKLLDIARVGKELGLELFVLDDGWFGKRNDDHSGLGDWVVNRKKLPNGINGLANKINELGLKFGLWVEPEMVSPDSDLYRQHPDWCIHIPGRVRAESRNQLVLDLSRREICEWLIETLNEVFSSANLAYIKWDMNRYMTDIGSLGRAAEQQPETLHRYMLGLYHILETLTTRFPEILFEGCSSGGGRFDPGMLHYMPQTWTSDNSDAFCRLKIQYGTSLVYPLSSIGAHVSAVPNHQVNRVTTLKFRGDVAMAGNFGYELDLTKISEHEKQQIAQQTARYKAIRRLIQRGSFYRLLSPFEGSDAAWMVVDDEQREALAFYYHGLKEPNGRLKRFRLTGLDPEQQYQNLDTHEIAYGSELMHFGIDLSIPEHDFDSQVFHYKAIH